MATGDGAEARIALSPVEDSGVRRQGEIGPVQSGGGSTLRFDVSGKMAGCCLWGPVDGGQVPIGPRHRTDVVVFEGPMQYSALDIQLRQKVGEKQSGR